MLGAPQSWSGRTTCPCQESNPNHPAHALVTILTKLSWEHDEQYNCQVIQDSTSIISSSSCCHRHHSSNSSGGGGGGGGGSSTAAEAVAVAVFNVQALQEIQLESCAHTVTPNKQIISQTA